MAGETKAGLPAWLEGAGPDARRAVELFAGGYTCSVAVALAFGRGLGLDEATLYRAASGFAGGMGGLGQTCGALSGAVLVLGLRYAPQDPTDREIRQDAWALVRRFMRDFEAEAGSMRCAELIRCDLSSREAVASAREAGAFGRACPPLVALAGRLLERYLAPEFQD